jgi:hypothetical protein
MASKLGGHAGSCPASTASIRASARCRSSSGSSRERRQGWGMAIELCLGYVVAARVVRYDCPPRSIESCVG